MTDLGPNEPLIGVADARRRLITPALIIDLDSLENNILMGLPTDEVDLPEAIHKAVFEKDLAAMQDGLETMVGSRGVRLSGGQIQRAAAARADLRTGRSSLQMEFVENQEEVRILVPDDPFACLVECLIQSLEIFVGPPHSIATEERVVASRSPLPQLLPQTFGFSRIISECIGE